MAFKKIPPSDKTSALHREALTPVLARLLKSTGGSRVTLRIDDAERGWTVNTPACEVCADGVATMRNDRSIDHRAAATAQWLMRCRRVLVQPDLERAADPAPPTPLVKVFGVKAQILGPIVQANGWVLGWLSVHYLYVPKRVTRSTVSAVERAAQKVADILRIDVLDAKNIDRSGASLIDTVGAFCRENNAAVRGAGSGPLAGLTFAAKDLFDIKGTPTGFGQPKWLQTATPPTRTAKAVKLLLDAGADLVGKAHCDELCYSLTGENVHYGTPENVNAPGRIPGGSSNGSAAAVAAGLVDFALGSDCGGSVRIPASYCGLFGIRPTWGRVSLAGAVPFGPSFDVAGWFARDPAILERVGRVLLQDNSRPRSPRRVLVAQDAFAVLEPRIKKALAPAIKRIEEIVQRSDVIDVAPDGLGNWFETFRTIQAFEVWRSLGPWIEREKPKLGPGVKERIEWARSVTPEVHAAAARKRGAIRRHLAELMAPGDILCLPTSPRPAPLRGTPTDMIEIEYRNQAMKLLCISGLAGLPQLSLPLATVDGLPLGLSVVGAAGTDIDLLALARRL